MLFLRYLDGRHFTVHDKFCVLILCSKPSSGFTRLLEGIETALVPSVEADIPFMTVCADLNSSQRFS